MFRTCIARVTVNHLGIHCNLLRIIVKSCKKLTESTPMHTYPTCLYNVFVVLFVFFTVSHIRSNLLSIITQYLNCCPIYLIVPKSCFWYHFCCSFDRILLASAALQKPSETRRLRVVPKATSIEQTISCVVNVAI